MPIFDQGYQHWSGELAGHAWRWLAITRQGLRVALAGRAIRLVLIVAVLPALALAFALAMWGLLEQKIRFDHVDHADVRASSIPRFSPAPGPIAWKSGRSATVTSSVLKPGSRWS